MAKLTSFGKYLPLTDRCLLVAIFGSLFLHVCLLMIVLVDYIALGFEAPDKTSEVLAYPIMLLHLCGLAILTGGTVLAVESQHLKLLVICSISAVLSFICGLLRMVFYLVFAGFFPEELRAN